MDGAPNSNNTEGEDGMPTQTIKLVLFGASRTGKTALLRRFLDNKFEERYVETVEEMYRKTFVMRNRKFDVCFYDIGGSNEFPAMRRVLVSEANGFLIFCSPDVADSYDQMMNAWNEIATAKRTIDILNNTPCVIVLGKTDLFDAASLEAKQVLTAKIDAWIDDNMISPDSFRKKTLCFTELCAKTGSNVKSPFEKLAEQILPPLPSEVAKSEDDSTKPKTIGALAVKAAAPDSAEPKPPSIPKRGFSLYRRKPQQATEEDKEKEKEKEKALEKLNSNTLEPKKLDRAKGSSRSFIFRGGSKGSSKNAEPKQAAPADEDCCLQ